jgi:hypothetical protein
MSNGPIARRGDSRHPSHPWDPPAGLGVEQWRRAHTTALVRGHIQRDAARVRANVEIDPVPLAQEIRRRWGLSGEPTGYRFTPSLPLFHGYYPRFSARLPAASPASGLWGSHSSPDVGSVSVLSRRSPLSRSLGWARIIDTAGSVQKSSTTSPILAWRQLDVPNPVQTVNRPVYGQIYGQRASSLRPMRHYSILSHTFLHRQVGMAGGAIPHGVSLSSAVPHEVLLTVFHRDIQWPSHTGPVTQESAQKSPKWPVQRHVPGTDSRNPAADVQRFVPWNERLDIREGSTLNTIAEFPGPVLPMVFRDQQRSAPGNPLSRLPLLLARSHPVRQTSLERAAQALPVPPGSSLVTVATPPHAMRLMRPLGEVDGVGGAAAKSDVLLFRTIRLEHSVDRIHPSHHRDTVRYAPSLSGALPQKATLHVEGDRRPLLMSLPPPPVLMPLQAATHVSEAATPLRRRGAHSATVVQDGSPLMRRLGQASATGSAVATGPLWPAAIWHYDMPRRHFLWRLGREFREPHRSIGGALSPGTSWSIATSSSSLSSSNSRAMFVVSPRLTIPVASMRGPLWSRPPLLRHQDRGPYTPSLALTGTQWAGINVRPETVPPLQAGVHGETASQAGKALAAMVRARVREPQTGVESIVQNHVARRPPLRPNLTTLGLLSIGSSAEGWGGAGDARVPMSRLFLVQPHDNPAIRLQRSDNPLPVATSRLSAMRRISPIGEVEASRIRDGIISPPTLALQALQRYVLTRSRSPRNRSPSPYYEDVKTFLSHAGEAGFRTTGQQTPIRLEQGGGLLHPSSVGINGPKQRPIAAQRNVSSRSMPLTITRAGETSAAATGQWPTTPNMQGVIQPKEAVHTAGSYPMAIAPVQAWSRTAAPPPLLHHLQPWTERQEQSSMGHLSETAHDMPLAAPPATQGRDSVIWQPRVDGALVQASPQPRASTALGTTMTGRAEEAEVHQADIGGSQSRIDLDELVEKAWQKLMHRLRIEQERRGYSR